MRARTDEFMDRSISIANRSCTISNASVTRKSRSMIKGDHILILNGLEGIIEAVRKDDLALAEIIPRANPKGGSE